MQVFNAFRISSILVYVDKELTNDNGTEESLLETLEYSPAFVQVPKFNNFEKLYIDAIKQIKKEFSNWEAGAKIDITKVRGMIIPLIEKVLEDRSYIFHLNSYSNSKDYLYHHCIANRI